MLGSPDFLLLCALGGDVEVCLEGEFGAEAEVRIEFDVALGELGALNAEDCGGIS